MQEAVAANEEAILERRYEIRTSLRAVENSLREAGAATDGYNSAYWLESPSAHWDNLSSSSMFYRQAEHVSRATLARSATHRFGFDAPDAVRYHWRLTPLSEAKCRQIWSLFDADKDEKWTHEEFREYMVALQCSKDSVELRAFEDSAEVWRMYMSDMCELVEEGKLTFEGFKMYRELIEDEQPLVRDLAVLGISLEWEELERMETIKQRFDGYVDDPMGTITAKAAQYLLAEIGILLTSEETIENIERRYQHARCQRFIHQLKRTLRLFGYRQKSALQFTNEGLPNKTGNNEEQPRICKVGLLSLVFSSWSPAVKTRWRRFFLQCRLQSFCALRRLKRRVHWAFMCVRRVSATGMLSASCLQSRTPGSDRGDYNLKMDIGPKFATTSTIHITYNSDADSAATLHELKYLERGAECFLYVDLACRSGTKDSDAHLLVDRLTWFIGEYFRDHIESLPFFHRWFVSLPTKQQLRMGPTSSSATGTPSVVIRLVILFTGGMDLYHVMQSLGLPSSMQFDHLLQRFSLRFLCSHSLEDILVTKNFNLGAQWSCRAQMDVRLNRQAWAQILSQVAHHLDAELTHEREDAEYIAQMNAEREQKKKKSLVPNQRRSSARSRPEDNQQEGDSQHSAIAESEPESRQHLLIQSLRRVAYALEHSQQLSSSWSFNNLGSALRENQWFRSVLSPEWFKLLKHVFDTPGGLAEEWKANGDSLRAEFADTGYVRAGTRTAHGHHPTSRATGASTELKNTETAKSSEKPKITAQHSNILHEPKLAAHHGHDPNQPATNAPESTEDKSAEHLLLEFYDLCARHLQGVHIVHAEAGRYSAYRLQVLDVDVSVEAAARIGSRIQEDDSQCIAVCHKNRVIAIANGRFVDLYGVSNNSLHPFTFLHQITISDHVTRLRSSVLNNNNEPGQDPVVATSVAFPVPGILLVGAFVGVPESENLGTESTVDPVLLLGFRFYAGSVTQFTGVVDREKSRKVAASVQVYFSFVEPVVAIGGKSIQSLQSFRHDMTPDAGSVLVLFGDSKMFGIFSWKERFSDRQVCLAQIKQQSDNLVVAECSQDGRYVVLGDTGGRLSLIDFKDFQHDGRDISLKTQQSVGKRLELRECSRSGVIARDNPLEHVRVAHSLATSGMDCAYTSLRWWMCGIRVHQKQFILAGKQDGSLNILKLVQGKDEARPTVELRFVQVRRVMYPGLASEMRWRSWRIKIAEVGEELSKRYRIIWPSVRDSLDFPSFVIQTQTVKSIVLLPKSSEFSRFIAKALADSSPGHTYRYPISLIITANRLQVVGLLTEAAVDTDETFSGSGSDASEHDDSDNDDKQSECEEAQEEVATIDTEEKEHNLSGPTTIQDKYKLPPMEWKATTSAVVNGNLNEGRRSKENAQEGVSTSKVSRVDYNERVTSVMQRVETLSGVMKLMRTSFQLFSSDVQQHINLISEQLEEISRRRVTIETAQSSRIG
ncbi:hypothetical protein PC129_g3564 [Phytophthora cactorum]|uniref:EF-hand domain-containing protein n=1 Tax=Phytophthora cactorum TaxID=29920 RepID=A0A8T1IL83_9STRA|nr:hypothetical protein PC129_g3564 [Phytophthora cactorum]